MYYCDRDVHRSVHTSCIIKSLLFIFFPLSSTVLPLGPFPPIPLPSRTSGLTFWQTPCLSSVVKSFRYLILSLSRQNLRCRHYRSVASLVKTFKQRYSTLLSNNVNENVAWQFQGSFLRRYRTSEPRMHANGSSPSVRGTVRVFIEMIGRFFALRCRAFASRPRKDIQTDFLNSWFGRRCKRRFGYQKKHGLQRCDFLGTWILL